MTAPSGGRTVALVPPPPHPFDQLHPELVETLGRSFVDRMAGCPLAGANLMYGFRAGHPPPATLWQALADLGPSGVSFLVRMFDRIRALDGSFALWRQIGYVRNQWWGGSAGMKVVYRDPAAVRACLDGLFSPHRRPTVARDTYLGALEHQGASAIRLALRDVARLFDDDRDPPDCDTWREVGVPGGEAMHFCVDKGDVGPRAPPHPEEAAAGFTFHRALARDDVHIDWVSPVTGVGPGKNRCRYAVARGARHWLQARTGLGKPVFVFDRVEELLARSRGSGSGGRRRAGIAELARRWDAEKLALAARGEAGLEGARRYLGELSRLRRG